MHVNLLNNFHISITRTKVDRPYKTPFDIGLLHSQYHEAISNSGSSPVPLFIFFTINNALRVGAPHATSDSPKDPLNEIFFIC